LPIFFDSRTDRSVHLTFFFCAGCGCEQVFLQQVSGRLDGGLASNRFKTLMKILNIHGNIFDINQRRFDDKNEGIMRFEMNLTWNMHEIRLFCLVYMY
jgi:hypothetical protein